MTPLPKRFGVRLDRRFETVVGCVVLVFGLFYLFAGLPWFPMSGSANVVAGRTWAIPVSDPFSLDREMSVVVHWSSSSAIYVIVQSCGSNPQCPHPSSIQALGATTTAGSLRFEGVSGTYYAITPSGNATLSYSESSPYPYFFLALPVLIAGAIILGVGVWLPRAVVDPDDLATNDASSVRPTKTPTPEERGELESLLERVRTSENRVAIQCPQCLATNLVDHEATADDALVCPSCEAPQVPARVIDDLRTALGSDSRSTKS